MTPEQYYEQERLKGITNPISGIPTPNYDQPFYQTIFKLMQGYADLHAGKGPTVKENPYACFGRKPHPMDFDDNEEFQVRKERYDRWEAENNPEITIPKNLIP